MDGRLFIGTTGREVYSLDASSGCVYWQFHDDSPVRTAISVGRAGDRDAIFFGDQHAKAYALDADSGKLLWTTQVESYPDALITGAPTLVGNRLYVPVASNEDAYGASPKYPCCKFRGSVSALDAATGRILWKSYTIAQAPHPTRKSAAGTQLWGPSGAGVWTSPTVDEAHHRLYVTSGNSHSDPAASTSDAFIAFDLRSGRLLWSHQSTGRDAYTLACDLPPPYRVNCPTENGPDFDFASSAMLVSLPGGHRLLIAGQKSGVLHAIDPDADGRVVWERTVGHGGRVGGIQWGAATDGRNVYVALSDVKIRPVPPGTPGAQSALGASLELDPNVGGGLFAFDLRSGRLLWSHQSTGRDAYTLACDLPPPYRVNCPKENGPDFDFAS
ncbi:MAG: PQQ-binding-like beta-propeller repeat protein, partial [Steroidobacteraceae bacterium]